jgi:hypothetical protein
MIVGSGCSSSFLGELPVLEIFLTTVKEILAEQLTAGTTCRSQVWATENAKRRVNGTGHRECRGSAQLKITISFCHVKREYLNSAALLARGLALIVPVQCKFNRNTANQARDHLYYHFST